jgi:hypothetical protein
LFVGRHPIGPLIVMTVVMELLDVLTRLEWVDSPLSVLHRSVCATHAAQSGDRIDVGVALGVSATRGSALL